MICEVGKRYRFNMNTGRYYIALVLDIKDNFIHIRDIKDKELWLNIHNTTEVEEVTE